MANAVKNSIFFSLFPIALATIMQFESFFARDEERAESNAKHGYEVLPHQVTFLGIIFIGPRSDHSLPMSVTH